MDLTEWNGLLCTNIHRKAFKNSFFFSPSFIYSLFILFLRMFATMSMCVLFSSGDWIIITISGHKVLYISNIYVYIPNVRNVIKKNPLQEWKSTEMKKKKSSNKHASCIFKCLFIQRNMANNWWHKDIILIKITSLPSLISL